MKYTIKKTGAHPLRARIADELAKELHKHGYTLASMEEDLNFILNLTTFEDPPAVRRKIQSEFVLSMAVLTHQVEDLRFLCYNTLIKTLSNMVICIEPKAEGTAKIHCITPEAGFYHFPYTPQKLYEVIAPVIHSKMVINNRIFKDLPSHCLNSPVIEEMKHYGGVLDSLGVLPTPFPLKEVLSPENIEHLYQLFNIKGLSYGNISARDHFPEMGPLTFWMTARGVNKAQLKGAGEDIMLVTGYDAQDGKILSHIPPEGDPLIRVSVDAIEHVLIYNTFPEVGAILHVHAWIKDVPSTMQNYPCGTLELAEEVVALLKTTDHPTHAAIGLKNHGLTITGDSLGEIFSRIEGKLLREVPMMA